MTDELMKETLMEVEKQFGNLPEEEFIAKAQEYANAKLSFSNSYTFANILKNRPKDDPAIRERCLRDNLIYVVDGKDKFFMCRRYRPDEVVGGDVLITIHTATSIEKYRSTREAIDYALNDGIPDSRCYVCLIPITHHRCSNMYCLKRAKIMKIMDKRMAMQQAGKWYKPDENEDEDEDHMCGKGECRYAQCKAMICDLCAHNTRFIKCPECQGPFKFD